MKRIRKTDQLDDLLAAWQQRQQPGVERLEELTERVRARLGAEPIAIDRVISVDAATSERGIWWRGFATGLAAAVAIVVAALGWQLRSGGGPLDAAAPTLDPVPSIAATAAGKLELFQAVQEMFPNQVRWVAESNGEVRLGLEENELASAAGRTVALRLTVEIRDSAAQPWRQVRGVDVMTREQESVHVVLNDVAVEFWTCGLPDGKFAIEQSLDIGQPVQVSNFSVTAQDPRVAKELYWSRRGETEYRVLQTLTPLGS